MKALYADWVFGINCGYPFLVCYFKTKMLYHYYYKVFSLKTITFLVVHYVMILKCVYDQKLGGFMPSYT